MSGRCSFRLLLAICGGVTIAIANSAGAQATISKTEIRTAPPQQTHERLRDVIWDLFEVEDYRTNEPPTMPLNVFSLNTKPYLTILKNLCTYDRMTVEFDYADPAAAPPDFGPDLQMKARRFRVTHWWSFIEPPQFSDNHSARDQAETLCDDLPPEQRFFIAPSDLDALYGYLSLAGLQRDMAGGLPVELECVNHNAALCRQRITDLDFADVRSVEPCSAVTANACYRLDFDLVGATGGFLVVEFAAQNIGADTPVQRAQYVTTIVLTHPRPD